MGGNGKNCSLDQLGKIDFIWHNGCNFFHSPLYLGEKSCVAFQEPQTCIRPAHLLWMQLGVYRFLWIQILPGLLLAGESQWLLLCWQTLRGWNTHHGKSAQPEKQEQSLSHSPKLVVWQEYWNLCLLTSGTALLWFLNEQGLTAAKAGGRPGRMVAAAGTSVSEPNSRELQLSTLVWTQENKKFK